MATPPNIVGTYQAAGVFSIVGCTLPTGPIPTTSFFALVDIAEQTGGEFSGTIGDPTQGGATVITISGTVDDAGAITGTWDFVDNPGEGFIDLTMTGETANGNIEIDLVATVVEGEGCQVLLSFSSGAIALSWTAPDPAGGDLAPPRDLLAVPLVPPPGKADAPDTPASPGTGVTAYKVFRSSQPHVQPTPANLFATVPPNQTSIPASAGLRGSYFVVTACYADGMSPPSNEVSASATPGPHVTSFSITPKKLTALGTGFTSDTTVTIDNVAFVARPQLKKGDTKLIQKGKLANGQTIKSALSTGKTVQITFSNPDGGITNLTFTP